MSSSDRSRDTDQRIVAELRRDARQSNVALARKLGLTEGAVRRRIDNLVVSGALRFTVVADAELTGHHTHAVLRIRCAPHLIDDVIAELRTAPELERAYLCTGPFDITAIGNFASTDALREFRVGQLGSIAGIVEIQSDLVLDTIEPSAPADRGDTEDHADDSDAVSSSGVAR